MKHFGRKLKAYAYVLLIVGVTVSIAVGLRCIVFTPETSVSSYVYTLIAVASSVSLFFLFYGMGEIVSKLSAIVENSSGTRRAAHHIRRRLENPDTEETEESSVEL